MTGRITILRYRQVGRLTSRKAHYANDRDRGRFARQMGLLARFGYRVLGLDEALACLCDERPTPPRAVVLTFDDACEGFAEHALPVLLRYRFPATLYAVSGKVGQRADWLAKDPGRPIPRLLSKQQLRELRAAGLTVGSRTVNHVRLGEVSPAVQREELAVSKADLEDLLGEEVRHFCYPFGSLDGAAVRAAAEAGYASAVTRLWGATTAVDHPLVLPRKAVSLGDDLAGWLWTVGFRHAPEARLVQWRWRMGRDGG